MDDDFDLYGPPPEPAAPQGPPAAEAFIPYGQADELESRRLMNGISWLKSQVQSGMLLPEDAEGPGERMAARLNPLLARKQQTEQLAKRKAADDALEQQAVAQSIMQANAEFDASGFGRRVATFTDPLTGETAYFAPPGYDRIDSGGADSTSDGEGRMTAYVPPQDPNALPQQHRMTITTADGTRTLEQRDYALGDDGKYRGGGAARFGPDGRPAQPEPQQAERGTLLPSEVGAIRRAAFQNVARVMNPNDRRFPGAVDREAHMMQSRLMQSRENVAKEQAAAQRAAKYEESQKRLMQEREESRKRATEKAAGDEKAFDALVDKVEKLDGWKDRPYEEQVAEAKKRFKVRHGRAYGEAAEPSGKPSVGDLGKIAAELQRRQQAAQPPGGPLSTVDNTPDGAPPGQDAIKSQALATMNEQRRQRGLKPLTELPPTWLDTVLPHLNPFGASERIEEAGRRARGK